MKMKLPRSVTRKTASLLAGAVIIIGGGTGGFIVLHPGGGAAVANEWVNTSAGASPSRCAVACVYDSTHAYGSFQAALTAASGGDAILVRDGTYGPQTLSSSEKTTMVTITAEHFRQAFMGDPFTTTIGNVTVSGVAGTGSGATLPHLQLTPATGKPFIIDGTTATDVWLTGNNVTVSNSDLCNNGISTSGESDCMQIWNGNSGVTIKGNYFHDWTTATDTTNHNDFIQVYTAGATETGLDLDGNKFVNGPTSAAQFGGGTFTNQTIENNYFGSIVHCGNTFSDSSTVRSGFYRIRNNVYGSLCNNYVNAGSVSGTYTLDYSSNITLATSTGCVASGTVTGGFNVFPTSASTTCGTSPKKCAPTFLNGTPSSGNGYDIRLNASDTCAKNAGNPSSFAPVDFFGTARPLGAAPDAGAHEAG
jgi:hypothetical protein